jgi:hypothetical protein
MVRDLPAHGFKTFEKASIKDKYAKHRDQFIDRPTRMYVVRIVVFA